ncbi:MAG TPA: glutaredoxin domain-containing protein [Verrucomicrobiae bacterium]|nr:glutaredoxin domain-containing protein [Verrucomicrobiae bacterium]
MLKIVSLFLALCVVTGGTPCAYAAAAQEVSQYPPIVLYTTSWCPYSKAAKKYLSDRGIPFLDHDVEKEAAAAAELHKRYGTGSVPVIVIGNDRVLKGFSERELEEALAQAKRK